MGGDGDAVAAETAKRVGYGQARGVKAVDAIIIFTDGQARAGIMAVDTGLQAGQQRQVRPSGRRQPRTSATQLCSQ